MLRAFASFHTLSLHYNAKLCFLVTVCGKAVFFLQVLCVSLCQHDPQSIRAHIITALYGHVPLKPQPGPPFWVFHHFTHWSWDKVRDGLLFEEARCDFCLRCVSLFLLVLLRRGELEFLSSLFLRTPLLPLTSEAAAILPVVLVCSVEDQAAVCTVALRTGEHEP